MVWWVGMALEISGQKMVFVLSPFVQPTTCFHTRTYTNTPGLLLTGGSEVKSITWQ